MARRVATGRLGTPRGNTPTSRLPIEEELRIVFRDESSILVGYDVHILRIHVQSHTSNT